MYRGRLIWPVFAEIAALDVAATSADPDAGGPLTSGYDPIFREPVAVEDGTFDPLRPAGSSSRQESVSVFVPVQYSPQRNFDRSRMGLGGDHRDSSIALFTHEDELIDRGLLDAVTRRSTVKVNDRLVALHEYQEGEVGALIQSFPNLPGLFLTQVEPRGVGMSANARNLVRWVFSERSQGSLR